MEDKYTRNYLRATKAIKLLRDFQNCDVTIEDLEQVIKLIQDMEPWDEDGSV